MDIYEKKCKKEVIRYADGCATHGWMLKVHFPDNHQNHHAKEKIVKVTAEELIGRGYKLILHQA